MSFHPEMLDGLLGTVTREDWRKGEKNQSAACLGCAQGTQQGDGDFRHLKSPGLCCGEAEGSLMSAAVH